MKIKALDDTHLLIILSSQETSHLGINIHELNCGSFSSRLMLAKIFMIACSRTGFSIDRDQIAVRAMQTADGACVLIFSTISAVKARPAGKKKIYKIKKPSGPYIYEFYNTENLFRAAKHLFKKPALYGRNILVRKQENYCLILQPAFPLLHSVDILLQE